MGGRKHPLFGLVRGCLANTPERRPTTAELFSSLEEVGREMDGGLLQLDIARVKTARTLRAKEKRIEALQVTSELYSGCKGLTLHAVLCSQREVVEKDRILERKDEQIVQKDEQLTEKDALLAQKDDQLVQKDNQLEQKDALLVTKDVQVADKDTQLARQQEVNRTILPTILYVDPTMQFEYRY